MKDGMFPGSDNDKDTSVYPLLNQSCLSLPEKHEIDRLADDGNPNHIEVEEEEECAQPGGLA